MKIFIKALTWGCTRAADTNTNAAE